MISEISDFLTSGEGAIVSLPLLAAVVLWAVTDLQRFLVVAVMGAMILPATIVAPAGAQVALADVLLIVALAAWLIRNALRAAPDPWLGGNWMLPALASFVLVSLMSVAWSSQPKQTVIFAIQLIELVLVIPIAFATLPDSLRSIRTGIYAFIAFTCVMSGFTAIDFLPRAAGGDLSGTYLPGLHKNAIGSFVGAGFVFAAVLLLGASGGRARRALAVATLINLIGLFSSGSRGAILGALAAPLLVSLLLERRRVLAVVLSAGAGAVYLAVIGPYSGGGVKEAGGYESGVVRRYSFQNAWDKITDEPLLGTGGGTYFDYIPQLGIGLSDPNNMFLLTWAELGVLGMAALLFLLTRYLQLLWRIRRLDAEHAVLGLAAGGVALSMFVHFQTDITWTRGTSSLTFATIGLMLAVTRLARAGAATATEIQRTPARPPTVTARRQELAGSAR